MIGGGLFLRLQANSTYLINSDYENLYTIFLVVELAVIIANFLNIVLLAYVSYKRPPAHRNLTIIVSTWTLVYVPVFSVRIWFIWMALTSQELSEFLVTQSIIRTLYTNLMALSLPTALVERSYASHYLKDYERKKHPHVIFVSLLVTTILFITLLWDVFDIQIGLYIFCIVVMISTSLSKAWFIWLWRYNLMKLRQCKSNPTVYSLSIRFQIEENLRIFKLMKAGFIVIAAIILSFLGLVAAIIFNEPSENTLVLQILFDFYMSFAVFPVYLSFFFSVDEYRRAFFKFFNRSTVRDYRNDNIQLEKAGETYFEQLARSWQ